MASAPAVRTDPKKMGVVLEGAKNRLVDVLPKHITPERMSQLVTTLMFRTPKLQECDQGSILASVIQACSLGLDLAPSMGEAYLIPRWNSKASCNECQFQPGYQGLRKLAMQSDRISLLETRLVRQDDEFVYEYTPELYFVHKPKLGSKAPVVAIYSYAKLANGERSIEVMEADEIESIHHRSESYRSAKQYNKPEQGPWASDWNEMGRKTVLKRHTKSLPRSLQLAEAIAADDVQYATPIESRPVAGATASARLANRLSPALPKPEDENQEGPHAIEDQSQAVPDEDDILDGQTIDG